MGLQPLFTLRTMVSQCVHPLQLCTQHIASAGLAGCPCLVRVPSAILRQGALSFSFLVCPTEVVPVRPPSSIVYIYQ